MDIQALKRGDVLLFSADSGSFVSWAITFLSDAPVSHAALYYSEEERTIIEETPPQVVVSPAEKRFAGRVISVRRFTADEPTSLEPVISAARNYLNDEAPYADSDLYLIGMLLIYRKFTPDLLQQRVIIRLLKKATLVLAEMIDKRKYPGQTPMVCSQFVAQCYQDAGQAYELKFRHPTLESNDAATRSLLDQVTEQIQVLDQVTLDDLASEEILPCAEDLCEELQVVMGGTDRVSAETTGVVPELAQAMVEFAQTHQRLHAAEGDLAAAEPLTALQYLSSYRAMFVTPGDLLTHCSNLQDAGTVQLQE